MSWTKEQIELLITEYEKYPCLWEIKNPQYHNRAKRTAAISNILVEIKSVRPNTTENEIVKKWTGLRNTYISEHKKVLDSTKSGQGTDEVNMKCSHHIAISFYT